MLLKYNYHLLSFICVKHSIKDFIFITSFNPHDHSLWGRNYWPQFIDEGTEPGEAKPLAKVIAVGIELGVQLQCVGF